MRISDGDNPLDATSVHPESYGAVEKLLSKLGLDKNDIRVNNVEKSKNDSDSTVEKPPNNKENSGMTLKMTGISKMLSVLDKKSLAAELGIGEMTLTDIMEELKKPARDPREDMPKPILRSDVLEMKDLKPGMILKGTVRNVIDFGAFVDIGVHQDGLVHISQMTERYIKHPLEAVRLGDIVDVQVLSVDEAKKRISLTMKISAPN